MSKTTYFVIDVLNKRAALKRRAALKAVKAARGCAQFYLEHSDFKACAHYIDECRRIRERNGIPLKESF